MRYDSSEAGCDHPEGYTHDLTLTANPPRMVCDRELSFHKPASVPFDADFRLLSPQRTGLAGKGVPSDWAVMVGQGIVLRAQELGGGVAAGVKLKQTAAITRGLLWRNCGDPKSVAGKSGSPLEILPADGGDEEKRVGLIVGFQNWQYYDTDTDFLEENIPVGAELLFKDEDVVKSRISAGRHTIYCSIMLPGEFYAGEVLIDIDVVAGDNS